MSLNISLSPVNKTLELGNFIGNTINLPAFICLTGELGTGKTTFTKGLAQGLGIKDKITSPTFTLINEFEAGDKHLVHIDLYRLDNPEEIFFWGLDEYLNKRNTLVVMEWADKLGILCDYERLGIFFQYSDSDNGRIINISSDYEKYLSLFEEVKKFVNTWS